MTDPNSLELYETTKTTEGSQAQAKIIQDLFEGKGLRRDTAGTQLEGYYRRFLTEHSKKAYQELTSVVGLDHERLSPVQNAETVKLESEDKTKLIAYLLERNHRWIQKLSEKDLFGDRESATEAAKEILSLANLYHSVKQDEYEIDITGPVVRITFKDADAYSRFTDSMSTGGSLGLFFPMPLRSSNETGEWTSSSNTFINLVSPGEEDGDKDSTQRHEMYHAIDYFRLEQLRRLAETHPENHSVSRSVLLREDDRFRERLKDFFFDPKEFVRDLEILRETAPVLYDHYCSLGITGSYIREADFPLEEQAFMTSFLSLQKEVPAFIAGFLDPKHEKPFTDNQRDEVIRKLVMQYMPFRKVAFEDLKSRTNENEESRLVVSEERVDDDLQKATAESNNYKQHFQQINDMLKRKLSKKDKQKLIDMLTNFPGETKRRWPEMADNYVQDRELFIRDLQRLIDFFLNPGGRGYEIIKLMKTNLTGAMNAYRELAALIDNPYQALVDISLIPLSHWVTYTKRQRELLSRNS